MNDPHDDDPFHPGEKAAQARVGRRERLHQVGPHVIRDAMPEQHRTFFAQLPFVLLGALDEGGRPWASMLCGPPGFVNAPDARTLRIDAALADANPLAASLRPGTAVGVLGIEFATRRRNRANGRVVSQERSRLVIEVEQSFGNCPKYVHPRDFAPHAGRATASGPVKEDRRLSAQGVAMIRAADTFFIASASVDAGRADRARTSGVDVSHRGGPAGFVEVGEVDSGTVLTWPDYVGNYFFNTLGNLEVNPRAGLLFVDFDSGALLQLTGRTEVDWGEQRVLQFYVEEGNRAPGTPIP